MKQLRIIQDIVNHLFWASLLHGIALITLGVLIVLYPTLLVALSAAMLIVIGASLLVMAAKVRALWRKVPNFLK